MSDVIEGNYILWKNLSMIKIRKSEDIILCCVAAKRMPFTTTNYQLKRLYGTKILEHESRCHKDFSAKSVIIRNGLTSQWSLIH